jgi:4-hydroxythreonine-4-phosphate dehydrogenase
MIHAIDTRPLIAITLGDPSGIGPEIILKAMRDISVFSRCRPVVLGDTRILQRAQEWVGPPCINLDIVKSLADGMYCPGYLSLIDLNNADPQACSVGQIKAASGKAAVEYVQAACDLAMFGDVDAVVTAPINKHAINDAGYKYAGHTELLAERTGARQVSMLLTSPSLRVVHVSTHVSLARAIQLVTCERVEEVILLAHSACCALGMTSPRIAVAGLNPHAGEGGLFGEKESSEIMPAIEKARAKGCNVSDPQPPDTVFLRASKGAYDIVVAMYHDQGHIPMKLLAFDEGVNVSLGLPIIRTSVDHGTAFDIAGTGLARETSLLSAIDVALKMVAARDVSPSVTPGPGNE